MKEMQTDVTKERLYEEFNTVVTETEQLLKSVASAGNEKAGAFKAGLEQSLAAASERMAKIRAQASDQASAAAKATDTYVQDNPWRAVGIAAGVAAFTGLLTGLLIARR